MIRTVDSITVSHLIAFLESGSINLNPPYQRKSGKWSKKKASDFIGNILNGDTPGILYFHQVDMEDTVFNLVDGKQRCTTILAFKAGQIRLPNNYIYKADPSINISGYTWVELQTLHPEIISAFYDIPFGYECMITGDYATIARQFVNLNSGERVKPAERRHAIIGLAMNWIRQQAHEAEGHPFIRSKINVSNNSYELEDILTRILFVEYNNSLLNATNNNLDHFVMGLVNPGNEERQRFREATSKVLDILDFLDNSFAEDNNVFNTKISTVTYYWLLRHAYLEWNWDGEQARQFLYQFMQARRDNIEVDPILENKALTLYKYLMSQGLNHRSSTKDRFTILFRFAEIFNQENEISVRTTIQVDDLVMYRVAIPEEELELEPTEV